MELRHPDSYVLNYARTRNPGDTIRANTVRPTSKNVPRDNSLPLMVTEKRFSAALHGAYCGKALLRASNDCRFR